MAIAEKMIEQVSEKKVTPRQLGLKKSKETLDRLQSPSHITKHHYTEHQKVTGYLQDLDKDGFLKADRLMRYDTMFGTIQLGYDPKKSTTFLFANIKPSIYDTVASRFQSELSEEKMKNSMKTDSENVAYSSKRRSNAASIIYKKDAKPWSEATVKPYVSRSNLESFAKTMPFLQVDRDMEERRKLVEEDYKLKQQVREIRYEGNEMDLATARQNQYVLLKQQESVNSIITRKTSMAYMFFEKVNFSFDYQKQEIYTHYKKLKAMALESANETAEPAENEDEDN